MLRRLIPFTSTWPWKKSKPSAAPDPTAAEVQRLGLALAELRAGQQADSNLQFLREQAAVIETTLTRRQADLASTKQELLEIESQVLQRRETLRRLQADAPHAVDPAVVANAIAVGYRMAWDTMLPLMLDGVEKTRETVRNAALTAALGTVESVVRERLLQETAVVERVRTRDVLQAKREELVEKRKTAPAEDQARYGYYLQALDWALNRNGHPTGT